MKDTKNSKKRSLRAREFALLKSSYLVALVDKELKEG